MDRGVGLHATQARTERTGEIALIRHRRHPLSVSSGQGKKPLQLVILSVLITRASASAPLVELVMGAPVSATPAKPTGACSSTRSVSGGITYDRKIATLTEGATKLT